MSKIDESAGQRQLGKFFRSGLIRIESHGRDVYNRLLADVFANDQNVTKILRSEGVFESRIDGKWRCSLVCPSAASGEAFISEHSDEIHHARQGYFMY